MLQTSVKKGNKQRKIMVIKAGVSNLLLGKRDSRISAVVPLILERN